MLMGRNSTIRETNEDDFEPEDPEGSLLSTCQLFEALYLIRLTDFKQNFEIEEVL